MTQGADRSDYEITLRIKPSDDPFERNYTCDIVSLNDTMITCKPQEDIEIKDYRQYITADVLVCYYVHVLQCARNARIRYLTNYKCIVSSRKSMQIIMTYNVM